MTRGGIAFGFAGAALVALGVILGYRELIVLGLVAFACLLVALLWMIDEPAIRIIRTIAVARVVEGAEITVLLTATNLGGRRSAPVVATERVHGRRIEISVPSLPVNGSHVEPRTVPTRTRGVLLLEGMALGASDPLRLLSRELAGTARASVIVHPRSDPVRALPAGRAREWDQPAMTRRALEPADFDSLRAYVAGDDVRRIHWRTVARTSELIVRQDAVSSAPVMTLVLDTNAAPYTEADHLRMDRFEDAVRIVASLADAGVAERYPVEVRATDSSRDRPPRIDHPGDPARTDVFDWLAEVQPTIGDRELKDLADVVWDSRQAGVLGIVTGRLDADGVALAELARAHFAAVTVVEVGAAGGEGSVRPPGVEVRAVATAAQYLERFGVGAG